MRIEKSRDGNRVEFIGGGGAVSIILGIIIFLGGVTLITAYFKHTLAPEAEVFVYTFGPITLFLAAILVFGRRGVKIDRTMHEVIKWWGFVFIPLGSSRRPISDFAHIHLTKQVHRSKNGTHVTYPVSMSLKTGKEYKLDRQGDVLKARDFAEMSAKLLKLPLKDNSGSVEVIRNHDELDMSIREQVAKKGEIPTLDDAGEIPHSLKQFGDIRKGRLLLDMPPTKIGGVVKKLLIIPFVLTLVVISDFMSPFFTGDEGGVPVPFFFLLLLFFLAPLPFVFITLGKKLRRLGDVTRIYATRSRLEIQYGKDKLEWNASDIEEMMLLPRAELPEGIPKFAQGFASLANGGITVRSDKLHATFGHRFDRTEQAWIYKTLYAVLAGKG